MLLAVRSMRRRLVSPLMVTACRQRRQQSTRPDTGVNIQGLQGGLHDDPRFAVWLDNCQRWGLSDCHQKVRDVAEGRKTIDQLFKEQEEILKSIAKNMPDSMKAPHKNETFLTSPQGIQGDDCERYRLWLHNCQQFGFGDCNQQLADVREGRKTLSDIFAEQDRIIRDAAQKLQNSSSNVTLPHGDNSSSTDIDMSTKARLKRAVRDYGSTVIVFHVCISLVSLGGFYALVSSGVDVVGLVRGLGLGETVISTSAAAGAGTFVLAYAVHKVFAPARVAVTLTSVPFIVRYLRRVGVLKKR